MTAASGVHCHTWSLVSTGLYGYVVPCSNIVSQLLMYMYSTARSAPGRQPAFCLNQAMSKGIDADVASYGNKQLAFSRIRVSFGF